MTKLYSNLFRKFTFFLAIIFLFGCAPGVGNSVEITYTPEILIKESDLNYLSKLNGLSFKIDKVLDERISKDSLNIQNRKVLIQGSIPLLVKDAFVDAIMKSGGIVESFTPGRLKISISIVKWDIKVNSKFPASNAKANCELVVKFQLDDIRNDKTVTVSGKGNSFREDPLLNENDILSTYGEALNEAVIGALVQISNRL